MVRLHSRAGSSAGRTRDGSTRSAGSGCNFAEFLFNGLLKNYETEV